MTLETGYEERSARIEMIPLMDVVFLLLVFFIYAMFTMVVHHGVEVTLPRAGGTPVNDSVQVVTLTKDGGYQLDGRHLSYDDLLLAVVERHRLEETPILISADRAVPFGPGIELLAKLQQAGITAVTFQVAAASDTPPAPSATSAGP